MDNEKRYKLKIKGKNITEVWDFRLSSAVPCINTKSGTWVVQIWDKSNPDYNPQDPSSIAEPIEVHDTGIEAAPGDQHDTSKIIPCYEWLLSVRDKYALPDMAQRKSLVRKINAANNALAAL